MRPRGGGEQARVTGATGAAGPRVRGAAALAVGILLLTTAACTPAGSGGAASPRPGTGEPASTPDPAVGAVDAFRHEIEALRDLGDAIDQHTSMQEDIAACMNEQGFEYTPIDLGAELRDVPTADDLGLTRGTREYAEQFGFGISTDDSGYYAMTAHQVDDPNARYVASLSQAAQAQYRAALWGAATADDDAARPWRERGCSGYAENRAYSTVEASDAIDPDALWAEEMLMREAVLADDRVVSLHDDWAACMADAGVPGLAEPGDNLFTGDAMLAIREEFDRRLVEIQLEMTDVTDPSAKAALAALQVREELADREIAAAVADVDCRESTGYAAALRAVEIEHQARFFSDHREEYEAYAAAMAERLAEADRD